MIDIFGSLKLSPVSTDYLPLDFSRGISGARPDDFQREARKRSGVLFGAAWQVGCSANVKASTVIGEQGVNPSLGICDADCVGVHKSGGIKIENLGQGIMVPVSFSKACEILSSVSAG